MEENGIYDKFYQLKNELNEKLDLIYNLYETGVMEKNEGTKELSSLTDRMREIISAAGILADLLQANMKYEIEDVEVDFTNEYSEETEKTGETSIKNEHDSSLALHDKGESSESLAIKEDKIKIEYEDQSVVGKEKDKNEKKNVTRGNNSISPGSTSEIKHFAAVKPGMNSQTLNEFKSDTVSNNEKGPLDSKPFYCELCSKSFARKINLTYHQTAVHTGEKRYSCNICGLLFPFQWRLKTHYRNHTGERSHVCEVCHKSFSNKPNLERHRLIHTGELPYSCEICKQGFKRKDTLTEHHLKMHTGEKGQLQREKRFSCEICGKCFTLNAILRNHQRTHTGEKPFSCSLCNSTFAQRSGLDSHKRKHTGEKPYVCDTCGMSFSQKCTLNKHQLSHNGKKPHSCNTCARGFTSSSNLERHQRIHTGEKPYSCEICGRSFSVKCTLDSHRKVHKSTPKQ